MIFMPPRSYLVIVALALPQDMPPLLELFKTMGWCFTGVAGSLYDLRRQYAYTANLAVSKVSAVSRAKSQVAAETK